MKVNSTSFMKSTTTKPLAKCTYNGDLKQVKHVTLPFTVDAGWKMYYNSSLQAEAILFLTSYTVV